MNKIILASTSPYRNELFQRLMLPFEAMSPNVDEDKVKEMDLSPQAKAEKLACLKANAISEKYPEAIVIGGDQMACLGKVILDKPHNKENAIKQLSLLNGKTHTLITSTCVAQGSQNLIFTNKTQLTMRNLTEKQIENYIDNDQPFNCAGSYMLEKQGIALFSHIDTSDYTSIIGLPLIELTRILTQDFNLQIP